MGKKRPSTPADDMDKAARRAAEFAGDGCAWGIWDAVAFLVIDLLAACVAPIWPRWRDERRRRKDRAARNGEPDDRGR